MYRTNQSQQKFIKQSIKFGIRADGRLNNQYRRPFTKTGIINQANGSASVSLQFNHISFYATIKVQVVKGPPSISLSIESIKKRDQEDKTLQIMTNIIDQHFIKHIDTKDFVIPNSKSSLKVFVDVLMMNYPHQNLIDIICLGIHSAFSDLEIPVLKALVNEMTGEQQIQLEQKHKKFTAELPSVLVIGETEGQLVCDLTSEEYESMDSVVVLSLGSSDNVYGLYQTKGEIDPESTLKVIRFGQRIQQTLSQK